MSATAQTAELQTGSACVIPTSRMWNALLRSHLLVAAIAVGGLLAATGALAWLRVATSNSIERLHYEISHSMQLQSNIERSMTDLRAWMLTGDADYKLSRGAAWDSTLLPLTELEFQAQQANDLEEVARVKSLVDIMRELKCQQWWIEDMALTPGNRPAEALLAKMIDPAADRMFRGITAIIDLERELPSGNRRQLLADMADFRGFFTRSHAMLIAVVHQTGEADIPTFLASLKVANDRVARLVGEQSAASPPQRELIAMLDQQMMLYQGLADQIVRVVSSQSDNLAETRYTERATPLAEQCYGTLSAMVGDKTRQMKAEQEHLATASGWVCAAVFVLACGVSVLAGVLSYRRASAIADPIQMLCKATQEIAEGKLDRDIAVTTNDEVAILTHTFNAMRQALDERTNKLLQSNRDLKLLQERLETLIDFAPVAIVMIDTQRRITLVNHQAEELFGYRQEELLGKEIEVLIPKRFRPGHPEKVQGYLEAPVTRQMGEALELLGLKKDGTEVPVEVGLRPIPIDGEMQVLSTIVDNSKRKAIEALEKKLDQAHRLESIGQLAAGVAHEINSPMQFIDSNVGYINEQLPRVWNTVDQLCELLTKSNLPADTNERLAEATALLSVNSVKQLRKEMPLAISECLEGIGRVVEIVQAMKEMSHPGSEAKTHTNINDIAHSAATVTRNRWKYSAKVEFDLDSSLPEVPCYPGDLNRVLVNLIVNAADAIQDHRTGQDGSPGRITIRSRANADKVFLEVEDTGGGVPDRIAAKIFDPFFTTKEVGRGSGQGLAICYDVVVNRHGGQIECHSTQSVGATFRIELPIAPVPQASDEAAPALATTASTSYDI
ncbi:PAS domain S-box protein [Aeoliella sp. ICT_H6.2]|uniref:histidine kinase n=1 Tax=Aeoliella straminimaris TaxID=2954799 RepID=A0A9X2JHM8_9BACT|nr:ATP-binding protein [Aeoliella straminimaris]MCO6045986.1 PAS domain S-box protein [Aeoliella straminimaris]